MTSKEFIAAAKKIATEYKTAYGRGMCGQVISEKSVKEIAKYYPDWYKSHADLMASEYGVFGFDCVCLIKSILWGWKGDKNAQFGGAVYLSNGVPDVGTEGMFDLCTEKSKDFSKIKPGAYLHLQGHAGIYIGDGLAVECTLNKSRTRNGVIISAVGNIGTNAKYPSRTWDDWGLLPWVDYADDKPEDEPKHYVKVTPCKRGDKGEAVKALQKKLCQLSAKDEAEILAHSYKNGDFDGSFGAGMGETIRTLRELCRLPDGEDCDQALCDILNRSSVEYAISIKDAIEKLQEGV